MNNQIAKQKPSFRTAITTDKFQRAINNTLQDPNRARRFTSSIISAVSANPALQECEAGTIVSAALLGESLNLSPSPQLGQYYLVPFNDNKNHCKKAQFQLGYKGYIQLAIRSGYYKKLNVLAIKKGELVKFDPLEEEIEVQLIDDEEQREQAETIGYYAMFEYQNGFKKAIYWSKSKMEQHALKYSQGYKARKGYTFWEKDFDGMDIFEMQANVFARDILMPATVLHSLDIKSFEDISRICNVSEQSAKIRYERLLELEKRNMFNRHPLEKRVYKQFTRYIDNCKSSR